MLRNLKFSKSSIVSSASVGEAINYAINILVVSVFALINVVSINEGWWIIIPLFVELILMATGVSLALSTLFVKYRDIGPIWEVVLQAGMYATPIIYSLTFILQRGQVTIAKLMMLNPLAQIIQDLRHFVVYSGSMRGWDLFNTPWIAPFPYVLQVLIFVFVFFFLIKMPKRLPKIFYFGLLLS